MELIGGQESTNLLFWIGVIVGWAGGRGIAARAGVGHRLKGSTSKPPKPDKTGDLRACWSTSRGRGCGSKVMLHPVRVQVESGARVERQKGRPTLSCDLRRVVSAQSAVWRLYDRVDSGTHERFWVLIRRTSR
jgi:hypothetical protein